MSEEKREKLAQICTENNAIGMIKKHSNTLRELVDKSENEGSEYAVIINDKGIGTPIKGGITSVRYFTHTANIGIHTHHSRQGILKRKALPFLSSRDYCEQRTDSEGLEGVAYKEKGKYFVKFFSRKLGINDMGPEGVSLEVMCLEDKGNKHQLSTEDETIYRKWATILERSLDVKRIEI